ncbi:MAG: nucleotidyltransferase domain-containing protein [bacterium]|nr:nucleotidyltransferase domain-containing protein [bacterium]
MPDNALKSSLTLEMLRTRRAEIIALAQRNKAFNVRVFGSVARGEAASGSDVDFLVTFQPGSSIFDQIGLWLDLQDFLGCEIDLLADHPEAGSVTAAARAEAVPL